MDQAKFSPVAPATKYISPGAEIQPSAANVRSHRSRSADRLADGRSRTALGAEPRGNRIDSERFGPTNSAKIFYTLNPPLVKVGQGSHLDSAPGRTSTGSFPQRCSRRLRHPGSHGGLADKQGAFAMGSPIARRHPAAGRNQRARRDRAPRPTSPM